MKIIGKQVYSKYKLKIKMFFRREVWILLENKTDFQLLNSIILFLSAEDIYGGVISEHGVLKHFKYQVLNTKNTIWLFHYLSEKIT